MIPMLIRCLLAGLQLLPTEEVLQKFVEVIKDHYPTHYWWVLVLCRARVASTCVRPLILRVACRDVKL
jgi:hypothetical protein